MPDLFEKFIAFVEQHQLIRQHDYVLVAVSGGVDSVVLWHLVQRLGRSADLRLEMIHINHGLRGEHADRDQQFVEQLAKDAGVPIIWRRVDVPRFIANQNYSEEQGARLLRYRVFEWALKKTGADCLALGHQADDQAETVIDHFLRGSGVKGLSGMPIRRDKFIRPLLFATRKEIETYAKSNSLDYLIDATNIMVKYRRNRIRHELVPYLQQHFNPAIGDAARRTAQIMNQVELYLVEQARVALDTCLISCKKNKIILDINSFLNYFTAIQKYILFLGLERAGLDRSILTGQKLDSILALAQRRSSETKFKLIGDWQVQVNQQQLVLLKEIVADFQIPVAGDGSFDLLNGELKFSIEHIERDQLPTKFPDHKQAEYIDADKIEGRLIVRNFRTGDRFQPLNFNGEKKLSDFFIDLKIPLHQRKGIPLLVCDAGIIWIMGYQIDNRFKITGTTNHILKLELQRKNSA